MSESAYAAAVTRSRPLLGHMTGELRNTSSSVGVTIAMSSIATPASSSTPHRLGDRSPALAKRHADRAVLRVRRRVAEAAQRLDCRDRARSRRRAGCRAARRRPARLSSSGVPSAITSPRSTTAMRSHSRSASSRYWVVRRTDVPSATRLSISSQRPSRLRGSRPVVGSSRNSTGGRATSAPARSSRLRMPPEYVLHDAVAGLRRGRTPRAARSHARAWPAGRCGRAGRPSRGSRARSCSRRRRRSGPQLRCCPRSSAASARTSMPCTRARAAVGLEQSRQDPQRRRLAGAVRPEQAEDRARLDGQVDAAERLDRAVALAKTLSLYRRYGHGFTLAKERPGMSGRPAFVPSAWPERCDALVLTSSEHCLWRSR